MAGFRVILVLATLTTAFNILVGSHFCNVGLLSKSCKAKPSSVLALSGLIASNFGKLFDKACFQLGKFVFSILFNFRFVIIIYIYTFCTSGTTAAYKQLSVNSHLLHLINSGLASQPFFILSSKKCFTFSRF